jgi:hypothetical protein
MPLLAIMLVSLVLTGVNVGAQGNGAGWSPPVDFSNTPDSFSDSPILLCDKNQNLHALWFERADPQSLVYYRTDADGTWSPPRDVLAVAQMRYMDGTTTPDGILHLVWVGALTRDLRYAQAPLDSAWDPRQWAEPTTLATGLEVGSNVYGGGGTIAADQAGHLHIVYAVPDSSERLSHTIYYIRSDDGAASWSPPVAVQSVTTPEPADLFASIAVDGAGRIHVAWSLRSDAYASYSRLGYIRSPDGGITWVNPREIAVGAPPFGAAMLGVFAFGDDEIHLTWDTPDRLHQWSKDGGVTWSAPVPIMTLGAAFGGFNKLAKDGAGTLHVVAAAGEGVFHATWNGSAWTPKEAVDTRAFDPHGQQIAVCQGNRAHIAYFDRTAENEIWYSSRTIDAPQISRAPIIVSEGAPKPTAPAGTGRSATPASPTPAPDNPQKPGPAEASPSPVAGMLSPAIVGAAASGLLVIAVVIAKLARRGR